MPDQSIHPAIPPSDLAVEFELNGRTVAAKKGESIIQVAAREGVHVPHYCWHPSLSVAGNCRLCLVEMHNPDPKNPGARIKSPKPVIGCQTTVVAGSAVFTQSELAKDCQNGMMEFLLVNHPLDCPICDRGGECQLQRYSMEYGQSHTRMVDKKRKFHKPQTDPLIDIERNRCIMCTRCVRFCDEVGGEHVMGVFDRGAGNYIGTFGAGPVSNIFSGNVIDLCPVGCLTSRPFRFRARVWELTQTQSTGIFDASGPKVTHWTRNGKLHRTTPPSRKYVDTYTVNEDTEEFIDNLTRFGSDFSKHATRWDEPRVRMGQSLMPAAFTEAVRATAVGLAEVKVMHGAPSIAILVSPRATMEEGYLATKLGRHAIGTDSVDWRSSLRSGAHAEAADFALAHADGDMAADFDALVIVNGDYQHTVPTMALRLKERARVLGTPIVQIGHYHDPYFAPHASHALHTKPGQTTLVLRILWHLVSETAALPVGRLQELADLTGSTAKAVQALVETLKAAKRGLVVQSMEDCAGQFLAEEVRSAIALRQALANEWKYLPTMRDRNAIGLRLVGAQPGALPGDEGSVARTWRANHLAINGGIAAPDLLEAIEDGRIKALVCVGADALANYGDDDRVVRALGKLDFFVLTDLFDSPFARKAHVFFGAASNLERAGTYCDIQGNLARLSIAEPPKDGATADWETLCAIGRAMGPDGSFRYASVQDVFDEMIRLIAPEFKGSFGGLMLPGPDDFNSAPDPGAPRRMTPEFNPGDFRTDGAHFRASREETIVPESINASPADFGGNGFLLTFGTHVQGADYHLDRASIANILRVQPYVNLNAADAEKLGIEHGRTVRVSLEDGSAWEATARVTQGGPSRGTIYSPSSAEGLDLRTLPGVVRAQIEVFAREPETALVGAGAE